MSSRFINSAIQPILDCCRVTWHNTCFIVTELISFLCRSYALSIQPDIVIIIGTLDWEVIGWTWGQKKLPPGSKSFCWWLSVGGPARTDNSLTNAEWRRGPSLKAEWETQTLCVPYSLPPVASDNLSNFPTDEHRFFTLNGMMLAAVPVTGGNPVNWVGELATISTLHVISHIFLFSVHQVTYK